jgi:polysaccharide export outer membrane protein
MRSTKLKKANIMKYTHLLTLATCAAILNACSAGKHVTYLKDADNISKYDLEKSAMIYEAKIMPKDVLTIAVNTTVPEAAAPFNLGSSAGSGVISTGAVSITGAELQTYIVDKQGYIDYPVIGKLKVIGLTRVELQELIKSKIYPNYITEIPVVNVRFKNYKISVIGEVNNPGSYTLMNEQCTIFDALATAGDMTIYGRRDNVLLIREDATGKKNISRINLESASLLSNLDLYYLQQNDVIYVEPNRTKARSAGIGATESITISIVSTLVSVATLIFTILNNN